MYRNLDNKMTLTRKIIILFLFSLMILGLGAQSIEAGACERAAWYCMQEIFAPGNMMWQLYCLNGYLFCKKYVE